MTTLSGGTNGLPALGGTLPQLDFQIKRLKHELTKQDFCELALGEAPGHRQKWSVCKTEKAPLPRPDSSPATRTENYPDPMQTT
jgi:hypothetical protein